MNISPIISYSNNTKSQKINMFNFKNYKKTFSDSMYSNVKNKTDVESIFRNIVKTNFSSFAVADWFKDFYTQFQDKTDPIFEILKCLPQKGAIAKDSKNSIAYVQDKSIMFIGPNRSESIEFKVNNNEGIEFSRGDQFSTRIIKFYPHSNTIKSDTKIYGNGTGQVSETIHYKKDGTKKHFRNFLSDFFGI